MQHLNYCRQALTYFSKNPPLIPNYLYRGDGHDINSFYSYAQSVIAELQVAVKIQVPTFGRILDDMELRAIKDDARLILPFKSIAIEYNKPVTEDTKNTMSCSKRITLAKEYEEKIAILNVSYSDSAKMWGIFHPVFLDRCDPFYTREAGMPVRYNFEYLPGMLDEYYWDDVSCVLDLLNALACKNVHIEKSPAKATSQGKKVKAALPFDDYHYLTVDVPGKAGVRGEGLGGSHRSPREHLRRGHIRRLDSGPIWVNACVVNAGIGSKVGKSYLVRKSA